MENGGALYMNPTQCSLDLHAYSGATEGDPITTGSDTPRTTDMQFQYLLWDLSSLGDQAEQTTLDGILCGTHPQWEPWRLVLGSGPSGFLPRQIPETGSWVTAASDRIGGNFSQPFATDQICLNGTGPVRVQDSALRLTGDPILGQSASSPFVQGNDIHLLDLDLVFDAPHGQLSLVSPQQLEYTTGTPQAPLFSGQHRWNEIGGAVGPTYPRQVPDIGGAQSVKHRKSCPKEWPCPYSGCENKYSRHQERKRHIADIHEKPRRCPFCDFEWTRPVRIRSHLIGRHQHHFTVQERREICGLRGLEATIGFLAKCSATGVHSSSMFQARAPNLPRIFL